MRSTRLGDLLLREGVLSREQLDEVVRDMNVNGGTLISQLIKRKICSEESIIDFISKHFGRPIVDLDKIHVPNDIARIPLDIMRKNMALPIKKAGNVLTLAVADPYDIHALDEIAFISGCQVEVMIARESQLTRYLEEAQVANRQLDEVLADLGASNMEVVDLSESDVSENRLAAETQEAPVVKLVNLVLLDAIKRGASDIHLEPYEKVLRVRYRIDGVLQEIMNPPIKLRNAIVSRIKILARLDISERRLPQDGRIKLRLSKAKTVDFRVSVLPTLFGEKVVMRLLDPANLQLDMDKLGYDSQGLRWFREAIHQPYGMVLVTGPTGSGKTVSLYSAVSELNRPDVNICTAEDPVEFNFMGINQVNINTDIGLDFPAVLRSFLRQDPDIILIGEIRDFETASIGVKAALTGHLVLATLHTNDAPSTMSRLVNMGMEKFLAGTAVNLVSAQRLARRVCRECMEPVKIPPAALIDAGVPKEEVKKYQPVQGKGCAACNGTGFKGRIGIYQVMPIFPEIREAVYAGANTNEIRRIALRHGVKTLRQAALEKVQEGIISLDECLRVTIAD